MQIRRETLTSREHKLTWSCTSSSQSSSCMMCSKGLNSASLKWKCGSSAQLVSTSVRTSWMKETAFWDTWRSLWHAACEKSSMWCHSVDLVAWCVVSASRKPIPTRVSERCFLTSTRCGATTLQALIMWSRGRFLFRTIRSMASPRRKRWRALRRSSVDLASPTDTQREQKGSDKSLLQVYLILKDSGVLNPSQVEETGPSELL